MPQYWCEANLLPSTVLSVQCDLALGSKLRAKQSLEENATHFSEFHNATLLRVSNNYTIEWVVLEIF